MRLRAGGMEQPPRVIRRAVRMELGWNFSGKGSASKGQHDYFQIHECDELPALQGYGPA